MYLPLELIENIMRYVDRKSLFSFGKVFKCAFNKNFNDNILLSLAIECDEIDYLKTRNLLGSINKIYNIATKYNSKKILHFILEDCGFKHYYNYKLHKKDIINLSRGDYYTYDDVKSQFHNILINKSEQSKRLLYNLQYEYGDDLFLSFKHTF
jgi:hypothetical protein